MSRAYDFLEQCWFYYLLTIDGDYPTGRPISRILEKDGVMYFGTRTEKAFYRQLMENPNVSILGFSKGQWIRIYGKASEIHDKDIREEYLVRIPMEVERLPDGVLASSRPARQRILCWQCSGLTL
ncbi:MAG: pyridoxamine 5'-phosphate oxidase family protein [Synergistaceae bacterium]|nr:pyridoxamine 5'-phosphate oxidase family protein [Synergistaceae bacterium]